MDREVQERPLSVPGWGGVILSPSAQDRPSRLGPTAEGRSDSRVLHLHPWGQARYPVGGRRREDEPQEGVRVRAYTDDDEHQGDELGEPRWERPEGTTSLLPGLAWTTRSHPTEVPD